MRVACQDADARAELLEHARRRLILLADRMFTRFPVLHRREEAEDVFQEAMVRLWQSLEKVGPTTVAAFMGLAAIQMRRALRDLARRHFGRRNGEAGKSDERRAVSANLGRTFENEPGDSTWHPDDLACWSEFHAAADRLPEPERTAFDLLYYHELSQTDVAEMMQVSERQVRRYWQSARRELHRMLEGMLPKI
jgi:RNA polymerase sigma-70 factor (ECF subfamily)